MRRAHVLLVVLLALVAVGAAGCGGGDETTATPETVIGTLPDETSGGEDLPALGLEGDAAAGEAVWAANGCAGCHTLEAANAAGNVGPNLDETQPSVELIVNRVTLGLGNMPAFGDKLEPQQIADVAAFISENAGG